MTEDINVTRRMASHGGGIEMALAGVVFGGLGAYLDSVVGTWPLLFLAFFLFGFLGSSFGMYYRYKEQMAKLEGGPQNRQRVDEDASGN